MSRRRGSVGSGRLVLPPAPVEELVERPRYSPTVLQERLTIDGTPRLTPYNDDPLSPVLFLSKRPQDAMMGRFRVSDAERQAAQEVLAVLDKQMSAVVNLIEDELAVAWLHWSPLLAQIAESGFRSYHQVICGLFGDSEKIYLSDKGGTESHIKKALALAYISLLEELYETAHRGKGIGLSMWMTSASHLLDCLQAYTHHLDRQSSDNWGLVYTIFEVFAKVGALFIKIQCDAIQHAGSDDDLSVADQLEQIESARDLISKAGRGIVQTAGVKHGTTRSEALNGVERRSSYLLSKLDTLEANESLSSKEKGRLEAIRIEVKCSYAFFYHNLIGLSNLGHTDSQLLQMAYEWISAARGGLSDRGLRTFLIANGYKDEHVLSTFHQIERDWQAASAEVPA